MGEGLESERGRSWRELPYTEAVCHGQHLHHWFATRDGPEQSRFHVVAAGSKAADLHRAAFVMQERIK